MQRNIFLVGPMGAGKSTIGRQLGQLLQRPFIDSDREIEQQTGATIPLIFEMEGEAGFRTREKQVIEELCRHEGIVLATGGGAILDPDNRRALADNGFVVYLLTSVDEQLRRTARDGNRPLLQTPNPRAKLTELLQIRDPLYREVADLVIQTDARQSRKVVSQIIEHLARA
ncbi:shikimate kinase AroK [Plasticicumulans acidivorans]|uniref:Shikimate kinase n=1 Tax=Plasticicumulans acidivorans TaxID=886464 RepID=A0A317MQH1_9GAMM|nr:shikimate kinase AroK [Plasticicumulans acidivorans]PWV58699.1 shikimate kinase [Plasticicumulans acidivorans]